MAHFIWNILLNFKHILEYEIWKKKSQSIWSSILIEFDSNERIDWEESEIIFDTVMDSDWEINLAI